MTSPNTPPPATEADRKTPPAKEPIGLYETRAESAREVLERVDAILSTPDRWARGCLGVGAAGSRIDFDSQLRLGLAVRVCLRGAIALANCGRMIGGDALTCIAIAVGQDAPEFNDDPSTNFRSIKAAIAKAKEVADGTGWHRKKRRETAIRKRHQREKESAGRRESRPCPTPSSGPRSFSDAGSLDGPANASASGCRSLDLTTKDE